jgi:hypothetical protein
MMPVWAIWVEGSLVFSTSPESRKGRNLARDPRLAIGIERDDDVIVLEGAVEEIALDERLADLHEAKYGYRPERGNANEGWYRLRARAVYAWDRTYPRTATRFTFA